MTLINDFATKADWFLLEIAYRTPNPYAASTVLKTVFRLCGPKAKKILRTVANVSVSYFESKASPYLSAEAEKMLRSIPGGFDNLNDA